MRFIRRIYGGHVGEKYVPDTLTADIPPTCPPWQLNQDFCSSTTFHPIDVNDDIIVAYVYYNS